MWYAYPLDYAQNHLWVRVDGNVGISNAEETVTESREDSIAKEDPALEKTRRRRAIGKTLVWKTFKSIVFLICLIFLIIHSVEFFNIYYKYPTTIVTEITVVKEFKLPAITVCFRNTISFKDFCSYEPDRCEKPSNMEEFCKNHPFDCRGGTTNLTIPMQDDHTREIMRRYISNDSYNDALLFSRYNYSSKARTFIHRSNDFLKCYSENLHLYQSRSKLKTRKLGERGEPAASSLPDGLQGQRTLRGYRRIHQPQLLSGNSFSSRSFNTECGSYIVPRLNTILRDIPLP
ncbi:hypothetical protein AVEN_239337-1 [Araneus ventricosus]|uniref:Uncharacterized protein n=1 Tax=Araneus ventricosus TaxID=182803 RepID=A0A4Y2EB79_ARAVE|nr:hypothetical protein AVEN_239337-1 [Araneus ventricosus]